MTFETVLMDIAAITAKEQKSLTQLALKTSEETGELAQAVLSATSAPGCAYKGKNVYDVVEEAVDVIICAGATLFKAGEHIPHHEIEAMFNKKLDSWLAKIEKENK